MEIPILVLSLLRFSKMTSELTTFNHLSCRSSSTALGTRTGYWKPTQGAVQMKPLLELQIPKNNSNKYRNNTKFNFRLQNTNRAPCKKNRKKSSKIAFCGELVVVSCLVLSSEGSEFGQKTRKKVGQVIACPKEGHSTLHCGYNY